MSKRIRIFTTSDVRQHNSEASCWVTYKGKVLDVTNFLADHPGGEEFILKYAGRDVEDVMKDTDEHVHSESAYDIMDELFIGRLGAEESVVSDDWVATDDFTPEDTDEAADYAKTQFLDLRKPLMRQMWDCNFRYVFFVNTFGSMYIDHSFTQQSVLSSTGSPTQAPSRVCPSLWTGTA
jgi:4-hydroxysphinganine ceramide fatty acyl 2-hydroxylase